jgi:hypothetical protein
VWKTSAHNIREVSQNLAVIPKFIREIKRKRGKIFILLSVCGERGANSNTSAYVSAAARHKQRQDAL